MSYVCRLVTAFLTFALVITNRREDYESDCVQCRYLNKIASYIKSIVRIINNRYSYYSIGSNQLKLFDYFLR